MHSCVRSEMSVLFFATKILIKRILRWCQHCDLTFFSDVIRHFRHSCDVIGDAT